MGVDVLWVHLVSQRPVFCLESGIAFDGFTLLTYPLMPLILPSTSFFLLFFPGPLSVEYYCIFLVVALQLFSSLVVLIRKRWISITYLGDHPCRDVQ